MISRARQTKQGWEDDAARTDVGSIPAEHAPRWDRPGTDQAVGAARERQIELYCRLGASLQVAMVVGL
jgi:hypothetical protein